MKLALILVASTLGVMLFWLIGGFRWMDARVYEDIGAYYTAQEAQYHQGPPPPFRPNTQLPATQLLQRAEGGAPITVPAGTPVEDLGRGEYRIVLTDNTNGKICFDRIVTFGGTGGK